MRISSNSPSPEKSPIIPPGKDAKASTANAGELKSTLGTNPDPSQSKDGTTNEKQSQPPMKPGAGQGRGIARDLHRAAAEMASGNAGQPRKKRRRDDEEHDHMPADMPAEKKIRSGYKSETYDYGKNPLDYENTPSPAFASTAPKKMGFFAGGKIKAMASHECDDPDSIKKMEGVMQFIETIYETKLFKDVVGKINKDDNKNKVHVFFRNPSPKTGFLGKSKPEGSFDPETLKNVKEAESIIRFFDEVGIADLKPNQTGELTAALLAVQEFLKFGKAYLEQMGASNTEDGQGSYFHYSRPEDQKRVAEWNSGARTVRVNLDHPHALDENEGLTRVQGSVLFELVNASSTEERNKINKKKDERGFEEEALAWNLEHPHQLVSGRQLYAREIEFLEWGSAQMHHRILAEAVAAGKQVPESANLFSGEFGSLKEPKGYPVPGSEEEKLEFQKFFNLQLALGHAQGYMAFYDVEFPRNSGTTSPPSAT